MGGTRLELDHFQDRVCSTASAGNPSAAAPGHWELECKTLHFLSFPAPPHCRYPLIRRRRPQEPTSRFRRCREELISIPSMQLDQPSERSPARSTPGHEPPRYSREQTEFVHGYNGVARVRRCSAAETAQKVGQVASMGRAPVPLCIDQIARSFPAEVYLSCGGVPLMRRCRQWE